MLGERVPLNFWLQEFESAFFNSTMHRSGEGPILCHKMLHIRMQEVEMRISPLFLCRLSRYLVGLKDPVNNPLVQERNQLFSRVGY